MKLTKKLEAEIKDVYEAFWGGLLNVDIEIYGAMLDTEYRLIGTTEAEVFFNKKEAIKFLKDTAVQLAGNIERRNSKIKIESINGLIFITEQFDAYVLIEDKWTFYAKIRVSTLMQKKSLGWKLVQQHFSLPDTKAAQGETIGLEKISKENLELRDAIKRRTIELEHKNRELEIEAALERVRARSMAMHHSNELHSVIETVTNQLVGINLKFDNASFCTVNKDGSWELWISTPQQSYPSVIHVPYLDHKIFYHIIEHQEKGIDFFSDVYDQEETKIFFHHFFENTIARSVPEERKHYVYNSKGFARSAFLTKNIWFTIGIYDLTPFSDEENNIIGRFANVFEQSYTRFLDLQKAETQAREAQIQLSLERVRARAMAMHHSEELNEVLPVLFDQFDILGICPSHATISLLDVERNSLTFRMTGKAGKRVMAQQVISLDALSLWKDTVDRLINMEPIQVYCNEYSTDILPKLWELCADVIAAIPEDARPTPEDFPDGMFEAVGIYRLSGDTTHGTISFCHNRKPTEEEKDIVGRFATEFGRLYQRFLDLQKAEAQAREAQIEASLERVRARAMAMHHSDELSEVLSVLFEQFDVLGISPMYTFLSLIDLEKNNFTYRQTGRGGKRVIAQQIIDLDAMDVWKEALERWKAAIYDTVETVYVPKELVPEVFKVYKEIYSTLPEGAKVFPEDFPEGMHTAVAASKFGHLGYDHFRPSTEEEKSILLRFNTEFVRLYQRFLDLQKAEAQAREAKIEAALERTRTQSMLMQHSDEIMNVSNVFHEQLLLLGIPTEFSYVWLPDEPKQEHQFWATWAEKENENIICKSKAITYPLDKTEPYTAACFVAWESSEPVFIAHIAPSEVKNWFSTWEELLRGVENMDPALFPEGLYYAEAYMKYGCFGINIRRVLSKEEQEILRRFTVEFERTYTRFLDLQKAEAQAREAQVEAALERVRSQSMAMRTSEELKNVVKELRKQIGLLGQKELDTCVIQLYDESPVDVHCWASMTPSESNEEVRDFYRPIPKKGLLIQEEALQAYSSGRKDYLLLNEKGKLDQWIEFMKKTYPDIHSVIINTSHEAKPEHATHYWSFSDFNGGSLLMVTLAPPTDVSRALLRRFANVFGLAYRRFVDIKQAEAQAREAQIQLALERVRARTMAMQHSDELKDAAALLFQQVKSLGVPAYSCGYNIWEKDEKEFTSWMSTQDGSDFNAVLNIPLTEDANFIRFADSRQKGEQFFVLELRGERMQEHYQYLKTIPAFKAYFDYAVSVGFDLPETQIHHLANFSHGNLLFITLEPCPEFHEVFKRFAAVFDQTYTRFLDLQKAEAQAKEAKIEAALEKVRSRTMAMQRSDELADVAQLLFQQVKDLGITAWTTGFNIWQPGNDAYIDWVTDPTGGFLEPYTVQATVHPVFRSIREARLRGDDFFVSYLEGEQIIETYQLLSSFGDKGQFQKILDSGFQFPTRQFNHFVFGAQVSLLFITYEPCPEAHDIFKRFGKVFEQTYTRFLDLQKAEAQAREAKIEAALEKVRSRSLAMHKSDEIEEVLHTLFERLKELDIDFYTAIIILFEKGSKDVVWWLKSKANHPFRRALVPYADIEYLRNLFEARQNGTELISNCYAFEEKNKLFRHLFDHTDLKNTPEEQKEFLLKTEFATISVALAQNTGIHITSYSRKSFSEQDNEIFKRFAKVFEQAYTRFNDLQKAEAQAREAKIEAALERVRSRTMAMQHSEELQDAANLLFQQVQELGVPAWSCGYNIWEKEDKVCTGWMSSKGLNQPPFKIPLTENPTFIRFYESRQKGESFYVEERGGESLEADYRYMLSLPVLGEQIGEFLKAGFALPEFQINHVANFLHGNLIFITYDPVPESWDIFKRFAAVFEQTYTRFLDIKKAEAQAKEAKIELALERVRARAMAMQKSDELAEAAQLLYHEFGTLGLNPFTCGYLFVKEEQNKQTAWVTLPDGTLIPDFIDFPLTGDHIMDNRYKSWKNREPLHVTELEGEINKEHHRFLSSKVPDHVANEIFSQIPDRIIVYCANFSVGYLFIIATEFFTPEEEQTIIRFAKVFEMTYTRFLDLQKAEAQAKEAKIEAALEKVRSRTMGMQKSEELKEVIQVVYEQFVHLNIHIEHTGFIMDYKARDDMHIWLADRHEVPFQVTIPYFDCAHWNSFNEAKEKGLDFFANHLSFEEKNRFYKDLFKLIPGVPEETLEYYFSCPGLAISTVLLDNVGLYIENFSGISYSNEDNATLMRFGKVFQQTYTRFLDLQKAEAQAREAQIEAALERVRARTMGMQKSDELADVVGLLYKQFEDLDFGFYQVLVSIYDVKNNIIEWWSRGFGDIDLPQRNILPIVDHPFCNDLLAKWTSGVESYQHILGGEMKKSWDEYLFTQTDLKHFPQEIKDTMRSFDQVFLTDIFMKYGSLQAAGPAQLPDDKAAILKRFAKALDLAYTRMTDLQNAEMQAREAQIELGLERVRARAMAMQSSDELKELIGTVFTELTKLDIVLTRCLIMIYNPETNGSTWWMANSEAPTEPIGLHIKYHEHAPYVTYINAWREKNLKWVYVLEGADKKSWDDFLFAETELSHLPDFVIEGMKAPGRVYLNASFNTFGNLTLATLDPLSNEHFDILLRFAKVFDLTYTRFNDLQKAEAQAREAKIEAALERVRSKTMAMHKSEELLDIIIVVSEQLQQLNIKFGNVSFGVNNQNYDLQLWMAVKGSPQAYQIHWTFLDNPGVTRLKEAQGQPEKVYADVLTQVENNEWLQHIFKCNPALDIFSDEARNKLLNSRGYARSIAVMKDIFLVMGNYSAIPYRDDENTILKRFANVFEQAYKRFLDLQKAETQAREATIEATMEKVRARAMAMQKPGELVEVAELLRREMGLLGIEELETSSIYIHNETTGKTECWYAIMKGDEHEKRLVSDHMTIDLNETSVGGQMLAFYRSGEKQISIPMLGPQRKEWINYCAGHSKVLVGFFGENIPDRTYHLYKFSNGYMGAASPGEISAESWGLLQRATTVFSLAYTRFNDLQQAEASAREAVKQAALDRIRAEIASMRTVFDLEKITPLIWNELMVLGISFIRCGVFIMDEVAKLTHTFLSTPDGKAIGAFHLPYDTPGNISKVINHWRDNQSYIDHWDVSAFTELAGMLVKQGAIPSTEQYLSTIPHGGFHLHFLPFLQGMLYVGNTTRLGEDEIGLIQSVADAFSTAYARYEDFNKLEVAKQQVDKTLVDLKQAQTQLVQSEKMASLGELTAGIAHEIQNPLNFVNNFSDVSNELLEEMKAELQKGNKDDAMAIVDNVKQNLEKILHHGKRADAIVKGMLQHSRTSSSQKELTDINILADEYLRLAYHGLRAKDKSFNAKFETDFDINIGKLNIIPQEIGRVILNLINNAFYAVSEKKKELNGEYEPTVAVITKTVGDSIEVRIKDNGIGIPQRVLDKIFQPFFTTKPTGQGTGLGLSLAYDIIKAHAGELKVETSEGGGSEFIVSLPV